MDKEQISFDFGIPELEVEPVKHVEPNPMCHRVGYGPDDKKCGTCLYLLRKEVQSGSVFYKCHKQGRKNKYTGSLEGRDYRKKWRACKLYKERGQ